MFPEEIRLAKDRSSLAIRWQDGVTHHLAASLLRRHCRSAAAIRKALDALTDAVTSDALRITRVEPIGIYAVNLAFSGGEERGIFPWHLLRTLGE